MESASDQILALLHVTIIMLFNLSGPQSSNLQIEDDNIYTYLTRFL